MDGVVAQLMSHRAEFLTFLRKQGAGEAQAEDLFQSALLRGLEPWVSPPSEDRLVPWFYRVLRNAFIDQARRTSAAGRALERYASESHEVEQEAEPRRVCKCTHAVLAALKPEYETIIANVDVDGRSVEEAAQRAGITPNNAYVRLHRARKALRERLEAVCGTCATGDGRCNDCYCQPEKQV
jgi:RNA polymerase sigma-70 factor (ECF subfamily)